MNNDLNTTPQSTPTTRLNSLDKNVRISAEKILWLMYNNYYASYISIGNSELFTQELSNIIKQNIEGNVNWKVG